jgi:predicted Zn-dependent protease with MMP-like domain
VLEITDHQFDQIISQAMDELPERYITGLKNVLVTYENDPTPTQREKLKLNCHQSLYGLYEGIPLTKRGAGYNMVLPDRITLFKNPLLQTAPDLDAFKAQVKHTLWHEIAHYYGLGHDRIHEIERNWR